MPKELIKEFMDKKCLIVLFNESFGIQGKIVAIEDNWIKDISILPEKHQNKKEKK